MREDHQFDVPVELAGARLDKALATLAEETTRRLAKEAILEGMVKVNGEKVINHRHEVVCDDVIEASLITAPNASYTKPTDIPLNIVAKEDEYFIIDKPAGMVVHPARGHIDDTLANAVAAICPSAATLPRAGIVHRLDKDTSGILVVARTEHARQYFVEQFKTHEMERVYLAIVHGTPPPTGLVDKAMGRDRKNRIKMAIHQDGRPAVTRFIVLETTNVYSLISCTLQSGRTHQIRVHMESIGHPVIGDQLYQRHARAEGGAFRRQMLHAYVLGFNCPTTNVLRRYERKPPIDFLNALKHVGCKAI